MPGVLASIRTSEVAVVLLSLLAYYLWTRWTHRKYKAFPPGPTPIPFFGNFRQLPFKDQHETFREWAHTYGEVVYAQLFRKPMIILNSLRAVQDLMEKKGAIYSDRPGFILWEDVYDFKPVTTFINADDDWREHRKRLQAGFETEKALTGFHTPLKSSVNKLIIKLLNSPDAFFAHVQRYASDFTLDIGYGMDELTADDAYNRTAEDAVHAVFYSDSIVASLVDFFPILKYVPSWMPGAAYNRDAAKARHVIRQMLDVPFDLLVKNITSGVYKPSFASAWIEAKSENGQLSPQVAFHIKGAAATLYVAGAETSAVVLLTLILTMTLHPEILQKVQQEIDAVVGFERLPEFHDRKQLPYLECVLLEVYRWNPPVPLGVPHSLSQDDIYKGYFLPKGSSVISNIWAISRDPSVYHDPDVFRPERFEEMDAEKVKAWDPKRYIFGFGRR
ncbi:hypothetical protein POSPLADRAFT_1060579 [Postia placenta MAD-698-R-SB12]|uniref:Cytochrome P450 n=1 Tax=Postia placenta MAD-698-R-SB12 TaxID=670580 RepID=A0A1X6MQY0_9APHY|nr:hypothetical protein POSPLADRAFT_1060579 [Postia placenta MAD-698-R-SB12]OSX58689.1 hypothetical protein POSPLADRAFT_1060579 [Postia placenta MAD-698-R-SB12]